MDPNSIFYVTSNDGTPVAAKFLQENGQFVVGPNHSNSPKSEIIFVNTDGSLAPAVHANPNNYVVVPADYSLQNAQQFAMSIAQIPNPTQASSAYAAAFLPGGSQDLQRTYNGQSNFTGNTQFFVLTCAH